MSDRGSSAAGLGIWNAVLFAQNIQRSLKALVEIFIGIEQAKTIRGGDSNPGIDDFANFRQFDFHQQTGLVTTQCI